MIDVRYPVPLLRLTFLNQYETAKLPLNHDPDYYDYSFIYGTSKQQLIQMREYM